MEGNTAQCKYPLGVEVATGVYAVNENAELLLVTGPKFVDWTIPGGHVEPGETLEDCAKREFLEETGVKCGPLTLLGVTQDTQKIVRGKVRHFVFISFMCRLQKDSKISLQIGELTEFKWVKLSQVKQDPQVGRTIKQFIKQIITNETNR